MAAANASHGRAQAEGAPGTHRNASAASHVLAGALLLDSVSIRPEMTRMLRREQGSLATVFGGSGFLGRHAIRALACDGWRIRAAVRRPDLAGHLQPMGGVGQIMAVQANLRFPARVPRPSRPCTWKARAPQPAPRVP
jgi:hypothetical protein